MNKKIKVIDLLVKIANGEIEDKRTFKLIFTNKLHRSIYYDKEEPNCMRQLKNVSDDESIYDEIDFNTEVEILEDEEEIDIQSIDELEDFDIQGIEISGYSMTQAEYLLEDGIKENRDKIDELIRAVKQLDKKINKED